MLILLRCEISISLYLSIFDCLNLSFTYRTFLIFFTIHGCIVIKISGRAWVLTLLIAKAVALCTSLGIYFLLPVQALVVWILFLVYAATFIYLIVKDGFYVEVFDSLQV